MRMRFKNLQIQLIAVSAIEYIYIKLNLLKRHRFGR
jgi:hypothetical protein